MKSLSTIVFLFLLPLPALAGDTTEFCLDGEFNLGLRMQGMRIGEEWVPTTWCVITDDDTDRVIFSMTGKSNSDMDGDWTVAYFPPDTVRIVNRESPPDFEFQGTDNADEARSVRRIDPRRFAEELRDNPDPDGLQVSLSQDRPIQVGMETALPVNGTLQLTWSWNWENENHPRLVISNAKDLAQFFRATGRWREILAVEAERLWAATPGAEPIQVPGDRWPARVNMELINLADDVYLVRGVRTGFQHLVIDTRDGLVVADAPTNWMELHQIPPANMVPDLGIDGISENLIEFLGVEFENRPVHAVAISHFHDDHSGGAAAFSAAGADVYAPPKTAEHLGAFLSERNIPNTESIRNHAPLVISPVHNVMTLGGEGNRVQLVPMGPNPHVFEMLGVWAVDRDYFFVSDVHVPFSDDDAPAAHRAETECWFAEWAVQNLPPEVRVVNSHSPNETPVSRLAMYLESDLCL